MAVNLLLIGRSGNGKSSTGNSILGKKVFISTENSQSPNDIKQESSDEVDGKIITVVDGPYIKDTSLNDPDDINLALECAKRAMTYCAEGFHAVIIILKFGIRFTQQEKNTIFLIRSMFGDNVIRDYGICVFTYGDDFMSDSEEEMSSFETWCMNQTGDIAALFKECNYRCVIFNNRARDDWSKRLQRDTLLSFVDKFHGRKYTINEYRQAEMGRASLIVVSKRSRLEDETRRVLNEISVVVEQIDVHGNPEYSRRTLESLKRKIESHKSYLLNEAAGTQLLKNIFDEISVRELNLNTKLDITDLVLQRLQEQEVQRETQDENTYCLTGSTTRPRGNRFWEMFTNIIRYLGNWLRNVYARL